MNAAGIAAPDIDWAGREATDAELVAAVRAGGDGAFAELYRRHQPSVARFVRARVCDHGRAEDVVQETFVSALRRMRQTDSELAFRAWIFEIARNASIDLYRRSSRAEEVSIDAVGGLASADASRLGGTSGPDASLMRKESFDHFRGALDELSETHHRIIVMRELEGRSYREIGERMELSQAAVESTLFRARRKLEHEYEQLDSGHRCRLVGAAIGRLAEGMESPRDRLRLDRHARRCSACRRQARQLGVEPLLGTRRRRLAARAAAFLPLPGFIRRHSAFNGSGVADPGLGLQHSASQLGVAVGPSIDVAGGAVGKAVAAITAIALIGSGGATLGGAGPVAVGGQGAMPSQLEPHPSAAPAPPRQRSGERLDVDPQVPPVLPAVPHHGAVGGALRGRVDRTPAKNHAHRGPAEPRTPSKPQPKSKPQPPSDRPAAPPADLPPPVGDPAGGGSDPRAPTVEVSVPGRLLATAAPTPASPPSVQVRSGVPDLTLTVSAPDPTGIVAASLASVPSAPPLPSVPAVSVTGS